MPQNPLTLTRQSLYELVWSKPMSQLATDFGISDVGLAKRCRAVDVPIPYRGYWARKDAGQEPPKLPLPKYRSIAPPEETRSGPEPIVPFTLSTERIRRDRPTAELLAADERAFHTRIGALNLAPRGVLADTCAVVRRTARHAKHPDRSSLQFGRGERSGPIVNLDVTASALDRALLFADFLVRTAESLGWPLQDPPSPTPKKPEPPRYAWEPHISTPKPAPVFAQVLVDGVAVQFRIEERMRRIDPEKSPSDKKRNQYDRSPPSYRLEATGALRLICLSPHFYNDPQKRSWYDQGRSRIEDKLPDILWRFQQLATRTLREKAEAAEEARKQAERERLKHELSIRRSHHATLIEDLERQAGAWFRATLLRRYLRAMRRAAGEGQVRGTLGDEEVDFLLWAEKYADQLDPLSTAPRNPDQQHERSSYWKSDEELLKKLLLRVFGCDGHLPGKLTNKSAADCAEETARKDRMPRSWSL